MASPRRSHFVPLDDAAVLIGESREVVEEMIGRGDRAVRIRGDQRCVSLQSVLHYLRQRRAALDEMFRVTRDAGLYDLEAELLSRRGASLPDADV